MGVLGQVDAKMLTRYCDLSVRYRAAADWLIMHGETYPVKDEQGNLRCLQQWPQVSIAGNLSAALLRMEQELGMTPASRPNLKAVRHDTEREGKSRFFNPAG
jgi:P27 family predicted phage terminase small subunit